MNKSTTLTLKIIGGQDILDDLSQPKALTEEMKDFIRFIARTTVEEYIKNEKQQVDKQDRILRISEVMARTGFSRTGIYIGMNKGIFPKSINVGTRNACWRESEIAAWLNERPAK